MTAAAALSNIPGVTVPPPTLLYPGAIWRPLLGHSNPGTEASKIEGTLHIAEGLTAEGAYATFASSRYPFRTSAHFAVDRDAPATVYQYLPLSDVAFHASAVNNRAIGIECIALSQEGATEYNRLHKAQIDAGLMKRFFYLPATEAQYEAEARLIAWLCSVLPLQPDRKHWRTHHEAAPMDHHDLCCTGALDPDRLIARAAVIYRTLGPKP